MSSQHHLSGTFERWEERWERKKRCPRWEPNPAPSEYESDALPTELCVQRLLSMYWRWYINASFGVINPGDALFWSSHCSPLIAHAISNVWRPLSHCSIFKCLAPIVPLFNFQPSHRHPLSPRPRYPIGQFPTVASFSNDPNFGQKSWHEFVTKSINCSKKSFFF